jgi:hypothetical protein
MNHLRVQSFGPIQNVDVDFGDLTILIGQQASGKSIFLQLLKLLIDKDNIRKVFEQYSFGWGKDANNILDLYFGEGMSPIWTDKTKIQFDENQYSKSFLLPKQGRKTGNDEEELFYIPAQRILSIADGRPKNFMEFDASTPYVLRHFSETLRQLLQSGRLKPEAIFPIGNRLKEPVRQSFNQSIFHNGTIFMDDRSGQKKFRMKVDNMNVPFMTWSAGQKEFMPLLMGFYWLCPPSKVSRKDSYKYVIIEEPEMGLHPQAIMSIILQIIDLLSRGYKVVLSTHSPVVLEFAWAFNLLQQYGNDSALYRVFGMTKSIKLFDKILSQKIIKTFYFAREGNKVMSKDISSLDAGNEETAIAEWGGLSEFASRVSEIVAEYAANE